MDKDKLSLQYQLFIMFISIVSILCIAVGTFVKNLDQDYIDLIQYIDHSICMIFLSDFCYSFYTAEKKLAYLKWGWIDLIASIPQIDVLRYGRFARIFKIIVLLRALKSSKVIFQILLQNKRKSSFFFITSLTILIMTVSSIAILKFEGHVEASNIKHGIDAIWWSFVTITTVGYGDFYPVTPEGRFVASILMLLGIGIFSTISGIAASYFLDRDEIEKSPAPNIEVEALRQEILELKEMIIEIKNSKQ